MRKPKEPIDFLHRLLLRQKAQLGSSPPIGTDETKNEHTANNEITTITERVNALLGIINNPHRTIGNMLFFIMYDIENNKVRRLIAKYLEKKGCTRIQRSIFLADLDAGTYQTIRDDLAEVQSLYDNHDSIILCPVSTELIRKMKVIGQQFDIDIIMHNKNTIFI